jgi:chromosome segregation protein
VVGEQSAKSLRTDKMEGVIFNGTQARKPTGLAEVVLTLSLMEHFNVPEGLDLNPDGFTVGRRLYRSGESEYYLDGRRCRLKDIQALFEGTGLGPNSYALIEQGRIGQILSSKPADRRALIEEAARITLFKSRRYAAETKLELAQQNLLRVQDIIREVTRQLDSLRRQAAKARRYARLREELRAVQRLKFAMEHNQLRSRTDECATRFAAAEQREQELLSGLAQVEESRAEVRQVHSAEEQQLNEVRDRVSALRLEIGNARNLRQNQESQRAHLSARLQELERDRQAIGERGALVQRETERLQNAYAEVVEELLIEGAALDAEQGRAQALQDSIRQGEQEIDTLRSTLFQSAGRRSDLRNVQVRCQENLQRISARVLRLESEKADKARERENLLVQRNESRASLEQNLGRQKDNAELGASLEERSSALAKEWEQASAELNAQQEQHSLMQHRFSSLEEIERRRSNYSEGVQKFLSTRLPGESERPGETLADRVETDPRYETAIENYLNDPLQYILVERMPDAVQSVERLRQIGAGKCTFMTLRNGHCHAEPPVREAISEDGVIGYLHDLLRMEEDVKHAFERVLPDFASTLMVADLPTAFRVAETHGGNSFLTLSGESYSPRGTLTAVGERKSMAGFLALRREKRELQAKLTALRAKIDSSRERLQQIKQEQAVVAESLKTVSAEARKLELQAVEVRHQIARLDAEIQKSEQTENVAGIELSQLGAETAQYELKLRQALEGIEQIEEQERARNEELKTSTERLQSLKAESTAQAKNLGALISAHAVKQERKSAMDADLRRLTAEAEDVRRRIDGNSREKSQTEEKIVQLAEAEKAAGEEIERLAARLAEAETSQTERQKSVGELRETLAGLEERLLQLHAGREEFMAARNKIEIERARLENDLEHLERACGEEFHVPLGEIVAAIEPPEWQRDYAQVCENWEQLRQRIETFGPINMRALEEYQELDERYQFLNKQLTDIEQSIADTQKAIAEINRRSIEQFQDAFKHIRENFIEVFQILFKGGQCDLRLLDEGDVLESGLDIIAQPPGKRLQNVLLLSGGEKALTALALLIAIFRYRPSPFCVLDEVDAPLDDANVTRFTELITELSKDTQFIIITHNKRTMEIARTLYGITMEEPGVSKVVGVDFRQPERRALAS